MFQLLVGISIAIFHFSTWAHITLLCNKSAEKRKVFLSGFVLKLKAVRKTTRIESALIFFLCRKLKNFKKHQERNITQFTFRQWPSANCSISFEIMNWSKSVFAGNLPMHQYSSLMMTEPCASTDQDFGDHRFDQGSRTSRIILVVMVAVLSSRTLLITTRKEPHMTWADFSVTKRSTQTNSEFLNACTLCCSMPRYFKTYSEACGTACMLFSRISF